MSAKKLAGAVAYTRREADLAAEAVLNAERKLGKFQDLAAACEADLAAAVVAAQAAEAAAAAARAAADGVSVAVQAAPAAIGVKGAGDGLE